ncbi:MAG: hypothetical protein HFJ26_08685 [Clostridia bacterium]|nr:hypothetical protein [Clostridia bacterium]
MGDNYIELKEEKRNERVITNLKLNGVKISNIKSYEIKKEELNSLELTLKININPKKSSIEL